jgi:hypothetical protein
MFEYGALVLILFNTYNSLRSIKIQFNLNGFIAGCFKLLYQLHILLGIEFNEIMIKFGQLQMTEGERVVADYNEISRHVVQKIR